MERKNYVWVIEIWAESRWSPCEECGLTKSNAILSRRWWKRYNPEDKFRIKKYLSE